MIAHDAITASASALGVFQELALQFAAFEALLLAMSGLHKFMRLPRFTSIVHEFAAIPLTLAPAAALLAASAELIAASMLWLPQFRAAAAMLAAVIFAVYLLFILRAIATGRRNVDCGCTLGTARSVLGWRQSLRNLLLAVIGAGVAAVPLHSTDAILVRHLPAAFALLALYVAWDQALLFMPPRTRQAV